MLKHRRLAYACLETHVSDPGDRNTMPMTTLIGIDATPPNHLWLIETAWDGASIGDIQLFKNESCGPSGQLTMGPDGKPVPNKWVWWGGVPRGKVKSYRFANADGAIQPQTAEDVPPFEFTRAQREAKSRQTGPGATPEG